MAKSKNHLVYQFKITLAYIEPEIWRRIQVPAKYSFWDLHVAIQDAMGWFDYHLHVFRYRPKRKKKPIEIGIPIEGWEGQPISPSWEVPMVTYLDDPGEIVQYDYDFGDDWHHEVLFEGILLKEKGVKYPKCLDGARACPPEDCGGIPGYYRLLEILQDPTHDEYEGYIEWLKDHVKNYYPYDPAEFNPEGVHFDNPKRRLKTALAYMP
jgi:hypothetical protein